MKFPKPAFAPAALIITLSLTLHATAVVTHRAVPIGGAMDVLIDDPHNQVYVTTDTGSVQRYSLTSHSLLTPWAVGSNLRSLDITPDGAFLYIVDQSAGPTQAIVRKVNTTTGAKTNLIYDLAGEGAGGYDIVRLSTNKMLFTSNHQFSGASPPVRVIDLATDAISLRPGDATERQTDLFRSADGTRVFMTGGNTSAGSVRVYDAPSNSYLVDTNLWTPLNGITAALSPNGSLLAFSGFNLGTSLVHSSDLSLVDTFPGNAYRSGVGFTPSGYLVFADWETELFRFFNPTTLAQVTTVPANFDIDPFMTGNITFSANSQTMVYQDLNGIHVYEGLNVPEPASLLAGIGLMAAICRRRRP